MYNLKIGIMATITTEFGKLSSKKQRAVYLLVRDKSNANAFIHPQLGTNNTQRSDSIRAPASERLARTQWEYQHPHADIQDLTIYQALTFNDSCFRIRPNGDGRGNNVIGIKKKPDLQMQAGLWFCFESACYETSMALVTFSFGSVFGMVIVRMPSSTLAEIWSFTTSSGST